MLSQVAGDRDCPSAVFHTMSKKTLSKVGCAMIFLYVCICFMHAQAMRHICNEAVLMLHCVHAALYNRFGTIAYARDKRRDSFHWRTSAVQQSVVLYGGRRSDGCHRTARLRQDIAAARFPRFPAVGFRLCVCRCRACIAADVGTLPRRYALCASGHQTVRRQFFGGFRVVGGSACERSS